MDIPYTVEPRPDTGIASPKLGLWLFLSSEVMLFGSLFSAYAMLRAGAAQWPDQSAVLSVPMAALNTIVLTASSVTIRRAWAALRRASLTSYRTAMGATIALGVIFLVVKSIEYADKLGHGLGPATNNFLGLYFTMTGLHALHVLAGLAINLFLLGPGTRMWITDARRFTNRVEIAGLYWCFVDAIWILLVVVLYLL